MGRLYDRPICIIARTRVPYYLFGLRNDKFVAFAVDVDDLD